MKLQSLSNFALNNNEMDATKGGKRVTMTPAMAKMMQDAAAKSRTAAVTHCVGSQSTMVCDKICIEWKASTTPSVAG
jgi:hypothetical protein